MSQTIEDFCTAYERELDYYQEASRLCAQRLETLLEELGVRAIVTYRAKRPDKLKDKLLKRNTEKQYKSAEEIRGDIADFAGVRAALYFPGDRITVEKILGEEFEIVTTKQFPEERQVREDQRFSGYHATHYRVRLRADDLAATQLRFTSVNIEVQVASVVMHAWAEVEHDLNYKPVSGQLSLEEFAILDQLNGLVHAGELALEMLRRAGEARLKQRGAKLTNHYELAAVLYNKAKPLMATGSEPIIGRVDSLFALLQAAGLDSPESIEPYLENLELRNGSKSIAQQILDRILAEKPDLYQQLAEQQRSTLEETHYAPTQRTELIKEFLSKWRIIERVFVQLAKGKYTLSQMTPGRFIEVTGVDPELFGYVRTLEEIRNRIVAGRATGPLARSGIEAMNTFLKRLEEGETQELRRMVREAQQK
jgi:ppGpp synthetase/RelA/SpoT-type nucleotidyltranferase